MLPATLKRAVMPVVRSRGVASFILQLPDHASLLDVGCGNSAPLTAKGLRSDVYYVGLDVKDYNQTEQSKSVADEYHIAEPETFASVIENLGENRYDAVVSSHNIEHTIAPLDTLRAMCGALKQGGQLYMGFPSEKSAQLPSRAGTLNFHDDPTHVWLPQFDTVIRTLERSGVEIVYQSQHYRPLFSVLVGLVAEPYSAMKGRVAPFYGTWALYGFESVIWGRKDHVR